MELDFRLRVRIRKRFPSSTLECSLSRRQSTGAWVMPWGTEALMKKTGQAPWQQRRHLEVPGDGVEWGLFKETIPKCDLPEHMESAGTG